MAFATPEPILQAIRDRLDRKILGYTKIYDEEYYEIFGSWCERQYGHRFKTEDIVLSPGIIPALNRLVPLLTDMDDSILIRGLRANDVKNHAKEIIYCLC